MSEPSRPRYHQFAWKPTIGGSVLVDDGTHSDTLDLSADIGADYFGWAENTSNIASPTESIQGRLAALIETYLDGFASWTCTATYTWPDGTTAPPRTRYGFVGPTEVSLTFSSDAVAAQFGFDGAGPHVSSSGVLVADWQDVGHWGPRTRGGTDETWKDNANVSTVESLDGSEVKLWVWGTPLRRRIIVCPVVWVANIREDAAATPSLAASALRDVDDPNGLLEQLIDAAQTPDADNNAPFFRIYTEPGVYRLARMVPGVAGAQQLCEDRSGRRFWRVAFDVRSSS